MAAKKKKTKVSSNSNVKVSRPKNGEQYSQSELFEQLQCACEFDSKRVAKDAYQALANMLQDALKRGYKVPLPGIGKMQVRRSKARMGRNPMTGEAIKISAKKRVRLTPSKALKDAVL